MLSPLKSSDIKFIGQNFAMKVKKWRVWDFVLFTSRYLGVHVSHQTSLLSRQLWKIWILARFVQQSSTHSLK